MVTLPVLPEELRVDLTKVEAPDENGKPLTLCEYPGVVAYVRPLDLESASRWRDQFPNDRARAVAATQLVHDQLIRIEGLLMADDAGNTVPFDKANDRHWRSLPMDIRSVLYLKIGERATIAETEQKNSDSPSGSGGMTGSESSPAVAALSGSATS